jgi:phage terminase large subunit-like protein
MKLAQRLKRIEQKYYLLNKPSVSDLILEERAKYEGSLYSFVQGGWHTIEGSNPFIGGWHLEAISEHLEAAVKGQIRKLIINLPRRCCKTSIASNLLCPWAWATQSPELKFLYGSYSVELAIEANIKSRYVIQSDWYQRLWGDRFVLSSEVNTQKRFENNLRGFRGVTSVGGGVTGKGATILLADDPNNVSDMDSEVDRNRTNNWWDRGMSMSLNDPNTGILIIIQQRLHHDDLTGHLLADQKNEWTHLCLPMEFESSRRSFSAPLRWSDPRQEEGELLWPNRIGADLVEEMKQKLRYSEYLIAGQMQQRPSPEEGGIFKKSWFQIYDAEYPTFKYILQSWDTALVGMSNTKKDSLNCSSACTTWGVWENEHGVNQVMLLSAWKGMVEFPELHMMAKRLAFNISDTNLKNPLNKPGAKPHVILIEAKANGDSLAQTLQRIGLSINRFNPTPFGNKTSRARLVSHHAFAGTIWIPCLEDSKRLPKFAEMFLEAATLFPDPSSRDLVDTMSQALIRLGQMGFIHHPDDVKPQKKMPKFSEDRPLYIDSVHLSNPAEVYGSLF